MNDRFLEVFKELEIELRSLGQSVLDYENLLLDDSSDKEKLKICRISRNYLSHQDMKFITCSKEMIDFIENLALTMHRKSHIVANELIRQKTVKSNEYLKNILPLLVKCEVPVEDTNGQIICLINSNEYIKMLNKGIKRLDLPKRLPKLNYVSKDTKIDNLDTGIYVVTSNGQINGKYIGLCII